MPPAKKSTKDRALLILLALLLALSFIALFPTSARLADPLFTHPYDPGFHQCVLLVWPDHVEPRWVRSISDVSPRPKDALYTFNVPPERQAWVEEQVRRLPGPRSDSVWIIHIRQLAADRQEIQLETMRDGIVGLVYEARANEIIPLRSRLAGPLSSLLFLGIDLCLWGGSWLIVWFFWKTVANRIKR